MDNHGDVRPSVVLLFGAGASYGSGGIWRKPPLGKDLYESLSQEFPETWGKLAPRMKEAFNNPDGRLDFEKGMGHLLECELRREISNLGDLQKDMARYFSQFIIDRVHNNQYYKILTRFKGDLLSGQIVLSTLNYDCLIECAASHARLPYDYLGDSGGVRLLKLHGSCNFIWPGITGKGSGGVLFSSMTYESGLTPIDPRMVCQVLDNVIVPPAMSLFNTDKTDIVCPSQIGRIREEYKEFVANANLVVVVGVNPRLTGDSHVWDSLISMPGKLGIVDKREHVDRWRLTHRNGREDPGLSEGFIAAYPEICSLIESVL